MIGFNLLRGSAREKLTMVRSGSVQTCITSPPYWALRDYGVDGEVWADGWEGQLGLEPDPWAYIEHVCECFDAVHRTLRHDGTLWIVIGDTYARRGLSHGPKIGVKNTLSTNSVDGYHNTVKYSRGEATGVRKMAPGLKQGDLVGIPWMLAFALRERGWYLRQEIVWNKPNAMPESVRSRTTRAHEQIFMLAKSHKYLYDHEAIKEPAVSAHSSGNAYQRPEQLSRGGRGSSRPWTPEDNGGLRNRRSVWSVMTRQFKDAHFAVFPHAIVEPCLLAGSREGDVVLDPFCGTGTVGEVAALHGRRFVGVEVNPEYADMAHSRLKEAYGMVGSSA